MLTYSELQTLNKVLRRYGIISFFTGNALNVPIKWREFLAERVNEKNTLFVYEIKIVLRAFGERGEVNEKIKHK